MDISGLMNVNPILVDRVRLSIMVYLSASDSPVLFNALIEELNLTKGNLSSHIKKLEGANFIRVTKKFSDRRPQTTYELTKEGTQELRSYLLAVEATLKNAL